MEMDDLPGLSILAWSKASFDSIPMLQKLPQEANAQTKIDQVSGRQTSAFSACLPNPYLGQATGEPHVDLTSFLMSGCHSARGFQKNLLTLSVSSLARNRPS